MWFCAALLVFSIVYGLIRLTGWKESRIELRGDRSGGLAVAIFIAVMAASTFLVRIAVSEDASVLNVHPGDFPQYVLMFAAGAFGYRGNWMAELPDRSCVRWARRWRWCFPSRCSPRWWCSAVACRAKPRAMRAASIRSAPENAFGKRSSASEWVC